MRILIVEDDRAAAHLFAEIAHQKGFENVDLADSAESALELAVGAQYDLVTLDIQLPGASGLEVLSAIRNMCPHAIIAVISGHLPGDIDSEVAECADVMIAKPISNGALGTLLENAQLIHTAMNNIRALEKNASKGH
ncbi:MAG: response regulator [Candidatus Latescibacteria bacterium]|nr:response regulator [Candidatus Latescibacterota bacterium]MBT4140646.1 response regulator [Candidatus Latescibacterota bacterium]MBT5829511.1 response regulator [Candidatus Latescibacterota bacterium]